MKGPRRPGLHERGGPSASRPALEQAAWGSAAAASAQPLPEVDEGLAALVRLALSEDVGPGDATTLAVVPPETGATAELLAKEPGVLSGLRAAYAVIDAIDPSVRVHPTHTDGGSFTAGEILLALEGRARSLLTIERTLVNFLQRLSGVATLTRRYVDAVRGLDVFVVDTRKTTPGFRRLEKEAVVHGGGANHRLGLYDAYMIKDNHIVAAGGIGPAVAAARRGPDLFLVVEARTAEEVREVAALEVDQILLDNMEPDELRAAVAAIRAIEAERDLHRAWIEVSGGITLETIRAKAVPGVDFLSVGALTHSAPALDLSLDFRLGGR